MTSKFFLRSKTVLGGLMAFVPTLMQLLGVEWSAETNQQLAENLDRLLQVIGFALVLWGRFTATNSLTISPKGAAK